MSFTSEVKDELARAELGCRKCIDAELAALTRVEGTIAVSGGRPRLEVSTETVAVARTFITLLNSSSYDLQKDLAIRRSVLHKSYNYLITLPAQEGLDEVLRKLGVLGTEGFESGVKPNLVARDCCAGSYLRGVFLACGYIADPRGDFHLEMSVSSEEYAQSLIDLMDRFSIRARFTHRHNTYNVYIKGSESIVNFLALIKAHNAALRMEERRVVKLIRNETNRLVNADIANQRKVTEASARQVANIRALIERRGIDSMPVALQEICELRMKYPEVSIKELGELASPPLSKSAVYHRIRRINEMLGEQDD